MHMVVMLGVAVGRQHDGEIAACPARQMPQKLALRPGFMPIAFDADGGAVRQAKAGDVDRLPPRVLAPSTAQPRILPSAGIAAEMVDASGAPAEFLDRQGLDHLAFELVEPVGQGAAHRRRAIESRMDPVDPNRGIDMAMRVRRVVDVDRAIGDVVLRQLGEAGMTAEQRVVPRAAAAGEHQGDRATGGREQAAMKHPGIVPRAARSSS
jgi:hypothetical protein